jgi:hypothetical protein
MGATTCHLGILDERTALTTWLTLTVIHIEMFLMGTLSAFSISIVPESGATIFYASLDNPIDCPPKVLAFLSCQTARLPFGVDMRQEQRFISIDIAYTADFPLIQQEVLDWRP